MNKIACIAVDDEPWALALITDYIKKVPFLELMYETNSSIEALQFIRDTPPALIFLDIQMPDLTGMQLLKIMNNQVPVILTTGYGEYALEGYEHNVIDYLLKPVSFDRFYKAVEKAAAQLRINPPAINTIVPIPSADNEPKDDFIFIKTDNKMVRVSFKDILYVEGLKDYIAVVTNRERLITLQNLRAMEEMLPSKQFMRVHKSYILAINKIDTVERNRVFIGEAVLPVGDTYREQFHQRIALK